MFGSLQWTSSKGAQSQTGMSVGNVHGEAGHLGKAKDGTELSIIEQVDNGNSSVGIYYDEVDDMLAQQAHRQSEDAGVSGEKELGSSVQVQPNDLAGQNQESSPSQHQQLGQMN